VGSRLALAAFLSCSFSQLSLSSLVGQLYLDSRERGVEAGSSSLSVRFSCRRSEEISFSQLTQASMAAPLPTFRWISKDGVLVCTSAAKGAGKSKGKGKGGDSSVPAPPPRVIPVVELPFVQPKLFLKCANTMCTMHKKQGPYIGSATPTLCKLCGTPFVLPTIPPVPKHLQKFRQPDSSAQASGTPLNYAKLIPSEEVTPPKGVLCALFTALKDQGITLDAQALSNACATAGCEVPIMTPIKQPKATTASHYEVHLKAKKQVAHVQTMIGHQEAKFQSIVGDLATISSTVDDLLAQQNIAQKEADDALALHQVELDEAKAAEAGTSLDDIAFKQQRGAVAQANALTLAQQLVGGLANISATPPKSLEEFQAAFSKLSAIAEAVQDNILIVDGIVQAEPRAGNAADDSNFNDEYPEEMLSNHDLILPPVSAPNVAETVAVEDLLEDMLDDRAPTNLGQGGALELIQQIQAKFDSSRPVKCARTAADASTASDGNS
jgi:hypothetical protein